MAYRHPRLWSVKHRRRQKVGQSYEAGRSKGRDLEIYAGVNASSKAIAKSREPVDK